MKGVTFNILNGLNEGKCGAKKGDMSVGGPNWQMLPIIGEGDPENGAILGMRYLRHLCGDIWLAGDYLGLVSGEGLMNWQHCLLVLSL